MGGGLMQLVAYGAQDVYLTGNPQITFFKVVYRRHTNFSMECIQQTINGTSTLGAGSTSGTVTISRNGDLVHKIYVTSVTAGIQNGSEIVNEVELEIGGQRIDRHTAEWMQVWNELTTPESKATGLKSLIGDLGISGSTGASKVHIPLQFWFCRNPGLALPLIALQYHEVKLKCTWGTSTAVGAAAAVQVWADYIYLDTDERRRFAQISHEYLIEQIQFTTVNAASTKVQLNFNHPVKELIWTTTGITSATTKTKLTLNGHDRFAEQEVEYFQLRQPYDHHTAVPGQNLPSAADNQSSAIKNGTKTSAVQTAAAGINNTACDTTNINFVTIANTSAVPATAPANGDAIATLAGASSSAFIIGATAATSCIENGSLQVGTLLKIDFFGMAEMQAGTGDATSTATARIKFICAQAAQTVNGAKGTSGPLAISFTAFDNHTMDAAQADGIDDVALLIVLDTEITFPKTPATAEDQVLITVLGDKSARTSRLSRKINCYSFALKPEEHQPSGTCNFSRIDNANLVTTGTAPTIQTIFAINYNVLRIMSGMGGLAYSN